MTYALDEGCAGRLHDGLSEVALVVTIGTVDTDLDEFMMTQGLLDLRQYGRGQTGTPYGHDDLATMGEGAQVSSLLGTEFHGQRSLPQSRPEVTRLPDVYSFRDRWSVRSDGDVV